MTPTGSSVGTEDPAGPEVGEHHDHGADEPGRDDADGPLADEAAGDLRGDEGDEPDRPGGRGGRRGEAGTAQGEAELRPAEADAERGRGVVAQLEHAQVPGADHGDGHEDERAPG